MSEQLKALQLEMQNNANCEKAKVLQRFFKTGKGDYGEGDIFLGIQVPVQRELAKKYLELSFDEIQELLNSKIHEYRLTALIILISRYKKAKKNPLERRKVFDFYLRNANNGNINNWDLVDVSAPNIVGEFLLKENSNLLKDLAQSENLWERRIAIVSTLSFIRQRRFGETLSIAEMLMKDEHDLIHKAVGWMLREVGKKNMNSLELFISQRYKSMPRTMLRYAIEKFPEDKRQFYLGKK
jgi:3-methyladenine DNA glycosylase AlkD